MKRKAILVLAMVLVFTGTTMADPTAGNKYQEELGKIVDECIAACESKAGLLDSESENVRSGATLAFLKATCFWISKARLVEDLAVNKVSPNKYAVQCFLDERFNMIVKNRKPDSARGPLDRYGYFK